MSATPPIAETEPLREHVFDGIREFDNRLPNWWLLTFYGAIAFSFVYWAWYHSWSSFSLDSIQRLEEAQARAAIAASAAGGELTDDQLWNMSRNDRVVSAGRATFMSTCVSCHGPDLKGKIGPNLTDQVWIHGGQPNQIIQTITRGVSTKGMPTWGPVLGRARIAEVAAFVLSHHTKGEPITLQAP